MAGKAFSAIILAAGKSERMGRQKLLLPFDASQTFVERCVEVFAAFGCAEIIVVVNEHGLNNIGSILPKWLANMKVVTNHTPGKGRFVSLQKGLFALEQRCPVFLHNVDSPFVTCETLKLLTQHAGKADYVRPVYHGEYGHPVLVSPHIVHDLLSEESGDIHVRKYLSKYSQYFVEVDNQLILANINTPDDYHHYFSGYRRSNTFSGVRGASESGL
ncbi:MAG: NTP transferase domain-containing protein [Bacteroidales bacterium]